MMKSAIDGNNECCRGRPLPLTPASEWNPRHTCCGVCAHWECQACGRLVCSMACVERHGILVGHVVRPISRLTLNRQEGRA